jgi:Protein of unknown function (DUF2924)
MRDFMSARHLDSLPNLARPALAELWRQLFKKEPSPDLRKDLLLRIVSHRLQEQQFGGLSEATCRRLRQLASTFEANPKAKISSRPSVKAGTRLVRQWKEEVHVVEVEAEGYAYRGKRYDSLSELARLITGTRWSGPVFFGIKNRQTKNVREAR